MKFLFPSLLLTLFLSCGQSPKNAPAESASPNGLLFKFSNQPTTMDVRDPENWCSARFGEAALVGADSSNSNRRYFALSNLPNRIAIDFGNITASFILQHVGNEVLVFTSDNLPACLSNKNNFSISGNGRSFRYDNKLHISFEVQLQALPNGVQIVIDLPPDSGYGMLVNRCEACQ